MKLHKLRAWVSWQGTGHGYGDWSFFITDAPKPDKTSVRFTVYLDDKMLQRITASTKRVHIAQNAGSFFTHETKRKVLFVSPTKDEHIRYRGITFDALWNSHAYFFHSLAKYKVAAAAAIN